MPDGAYVVGFASRLVERKGWRDFLDAVQANDSALRGRLVAGGEANAAQYTMGTFSSKLEKIYSTVRPEAATEKQTGFEADRKI